MKNKNIKIERKDLFVVYNEADGNFVSDILNESELEDFINNVNYLETDDIIIYKISDSNKGVELKPRLVDL